MSKRHIIIQGIACFLISFVLVFSFYFIVRETSINSAKEELEIYADKIVLNFNSIEDKEKISENYKNIIDLRITILEKDKEDIVLEINNINQEAYKEDRLDEFKSNLNSFYYKDSNTLKTKVLYLVKENSLYYIRVGKTLSSIISVANQTLIFGTLIAFIICIIYVICLIYVYKKNLKKIYFEINKLEDIVSLNSKYKDNNLKNLSFAISEIKEKLIDTLSDLEKEKSKLNYVINYLDSGIIILNKGFNVILINKYIENLFSNNTNFINKNFDYFLLPISIDEVKKELETKEVKSYEIELNSKYYLFNFHKFDASPFNEGKYIVLISDISSFKELESAKKEFFQNSSHELKSPLTSILAYEEMINNNLLDEKEVKTANEAIYRNARKMKDLVNDMLKLSEIEYYKESLKKEEVNLKEIILNQIDEFKGDLSKKNISINLDLKDVYLKINKKEAELLLNNLISNAIIYNKENGSIEIIVNEYELMIKDTGIGIKEENISKIFTRFYHSTTLKNEGSGIGLSLVKHICINNNLSISVESKENIGTCFKIKLHQ